MGYYKINSMKYLSIIPFHGLLNWSVQYLTNSKIGFTTAFPMVRIGDFLSRNRTPIIIEDKKEYVRVRIKTHNGGVERRERNNVLGKNIGTKKQYVISEGQFIVSKIDARNGAMGIVPKELNGAIVTQDFLPYDINTTLINPEYFVLVCTTKPFIEFCQSCSSGTTNRQRVNEEDFLNIRIPVPKLKEQGVIVNNYNSLIFKALAIEKKCEKNEESIKKYLNTALGLLRVKKTNVSSLSFIHFKDTLVRWDAYLIDEGLTSCYPVVTLGSISHDIATGTTPPTSNKEYFGGEIKFFTPSDINGIMYLSKSERFITRKAVDDRKARLFHESDLLFVGIGSTIGKVGLVNDKVVSSNQQITGITLDTTRILPEYAFYYLTYNKDISTAKQSKTTLPIMNQEKIAKIPIPLPKIDKQKEIVIHLNHKKEEIKQLKDNVKDLRSKAIKQFENIIFE